MVFWSILFRFGHFFRVVSLLVSPLPRSCATFYIAFAMPLFFCRSFSQYFLIVFQSFSNCYQLLLACGVYEHFCLESSFIASFHIVSTGFSLSFSSCFLCEPVDLAAAWFPSQKFRSLGHLWVISVLVYAILVFQSSPDLFQSSRILRLYTASEALQLCLAIFVPDE